MFIREQSVEVRKAGPLVLIVTQTKEVAKEILTTSQMFMHQAHCKFSCLFDDENINTQVMHLRDHGKFSCLFGLIKLLWTFTNIKKLFYNNKMRLQLDEIEKTHFFL